MKAKSILEITITLIILLGCTIYLSPKTGIDLELNLHSILSPTSLLQDNTTQDIFESQYASGRRRYADGTTTAWFRPQVTMVDDIKEVIKDKNTSELVLLNLGCGDGAGGSLDLANMPWQKSIHIDLSKSAVQSFRQKLDAKNKNILIINDDILSALERLDSDSIDIAHAHLSLHYFSLEKTYAIFEHLRRVLKPGGFFIFKVFSDKSTKDASASSKIPGQGEYYKRADGKTERLFTEKYIQDLLYETGFADYTMQTIQVENWHNQPWVVKCFKPTVPKQITANGQILTIVPLTKDLMLEHKERFLELLNLITAGVYFNLQRDIIERANDPNKLDADLSFAVMDENNIPVGMNIIIESRNKRYEPGTAVFGSKIAVRPEFQGTGVGEWLLKWGFNNARNKGYKYMHWDTALEPDTSKPGSERAVKLYERLGAKRIGVKPKNPNAEIPSYQSVKFEIPLIRTSV